MRAEFEIGGRLDGRVHAVARVLEPANDFFHGERLQFFRFERDRADHTSPFRTPDAQFAVGQQKRCAVGIEREDRIKKFVPRDYWEIHGTFGAQAGEYPGRWFDEKFSKKDGDDHQRQEMFFARVAVARMGRFRPLFEARIALVGIGPRDGLVQPRIDSRDRKMAGCRSACGMMVSG